MAVPCCFCPGPAFPDSSGFPALKQRLITAGSLGTELEVAIVPMQLQVLCGYALATISDARGQQLKEQGSMALWKNSR